VDKRSLQNADANPRFGMALKPIPHVSISA
jgi:hypothetical protein